MIILIHRSYNIVITYLQVALIEAYLVSRHLGSSLFHSQVVDACCSVGHNVASKLSDACCMRVRWLGELDLLASLRQYAFEVEEPGPRGHEVGVESVTRVALACETRHTGQAV